MNVCARGSLMWGGGGAEIESEAINTFLTITSLCIVININVSANINKP